MNSVLIDIIKIISAVEGNPVKIQIGYTTKSFCHHDGIVIQKSNGAVLDALIKFIHEFYNNVHSEGYIRTTIDEENSGLLVTVSEDASC